MINTNNLNTGAGNVIRLQCVVDCVEFVPRNSILIRVFQGIEREFN
jgi:hypothetical protein